MLGKVSGIVRAQLRKRGYDVVSYGRNYSAMDRAIIEKVEPYTMTSHARVHAVVDAVRHVHRNNLPGAFVECGVWRGGSSMAMALAAIELKMSLPHLYLYDTFDGMSAPTARDVLNAAPEVNASQLLASTAKGDHATNIWCEAAIDDVQANLATTGYPADKLHLIKGMVENTIPGVVPEQISILRLDTDWYESTKHELEHLYPRLVRGGLLIVDDYGYWKGAREAVDEYFAKLGFMPFLGIIDGTGRISMKI